MDKNLFQLNNKIFSNNNSILLSIVNELQQILSQSKDQLIIKRLGDIIIKMNNAINENKKNMELIRSDISKFYEKISKKFDELKDNNKQEIKYANGSRYVGQVFNGKAEGKGIKYHNNGDRYEGEFKNDKYDGRGIYYYNNGDRYEGNFRNGKCDGRGIDYYNNGDRYEGNFVNGKYDGKGIFFAHEGSRYEGDYKNGLKEGKGALYIFNGDRMIGDYHNDKPIGRHAGLTKDGKVMPVDY